MCGGDMPNSRMEQLLFDFDTSGDLLDINCRFPSTSAEKIAEHLGTTPQVVGKIMRINDDMFGREIVLVDGKRKTFYFSNSPKVVRMILNERQKCQRKTLPKRIKSEEAV